MGPPVGRRGAVRKGIMQVRPGNAYPLGAPFDGNGNDGESHNRSSNGGVGGSTDDPDVLALRAQQGDLLATLLLSQGCR